MTLYRDHRGGLADAMKTVVSVNDRAELIAHLSKTIPSNFDLSTIHISAYPEEGRNYDARIGWHTYIVELPGFGVLGFTDGPL